jgi:hypothetical protein
MKTASRQHQTGAPRPPYKGKSDAREPDRIIVPVNDDSSTGGRFHTGRFRPFEYTDFEEITASETYDQMAFQEYADEDPSRLRVSRK